MVSTSLFAAVFRATPAGWWILAVGVGGVLLAVPLAIVLRSFVRQRHCRDSVRARRGGRHVRRLPASRCRAGRGSLCLGVAALVAFVALGAAGGDEGPRNAIAEFLLVVACFAALGRRLGLRR